MNRCIAKRMLVRLLTGILLLVVVTLVIAVPIGAVWGIKTIIVKLGMEDIAIGALLVLAIFVLALSLWEGIKDWYRSAKRDCEGK